MAVSEPPDSTASNKQDPLGGRHAEALSAYLAWRRMGAPYVAEVEREAAGIDAAVRGMAGADDA